MNASMSTIEIAGNAALAGLLFVAGAVLIVAFIVAFAKLGG